jgi:hypothetical protein
LKSYWLFVEEKDSLLLRVEEVWKLDSLMVGIEKASLFVAGCGFEA